jgi:hypothetical protein
MPVGGKQQSALKHRAARARSLLTARAMPPSRFRLSLKKISSMRVVDARCRLLHYVRAGG